MGIRVSLFTVLAFAAFATSALGAEAQPAATRPAAAVPISKVRIKDLADVQGVRDNQLVGNGLVVGLDGTGDKSGVLANQELANFATRLGVRITASDVKSKNIACVLVTAKLAPFAKKGGKIDVQVSSMGDAKSLQGGILLQTPLVGGDGRVYAVAQGALSVGGVSAGGGAGGATVQKNHTLVGRIPEGALVEREVPSDFAADGVLRLRLRHPDFTTARRMADAINAQWPAAARALDLGELEVRIPRAAEGATGVVDFMSDLEGLAVVPDAPARVVINERTGTIVAGANVRISPTAISHGNLYITIKDTPVVVQPGPLSKGETVVTQDQATQVTEETAHVLVLQHGPTLGELAQALNALKVTPRDIISIFQALRDAGALHAELVIM